MVESSSSKTAKSDNPAKPDKPKKTETPYGLWRSPMDLGELLSQPSAPMYPFRHRGRLHWLEALTDEGGRIALQQRQESGEVRCLTPAQFNIRTNAHEYGGRCFCLLGDWIIFNNLSDGRIYRQDLSTDSPPVAVTPAPPRDQSACFADLAPLVHHDAVIAVMETGGEGRSERDHLVAIDLSAETARNGPSPPRVLVAGADFYACPVASPDAAELAWLEWDNPFMPWDEGRLVKAELAAGSAGLEIRNRRVLVAEGERAVGQPGFLEDHSLLFVSDSGDNDFWNFFRYKDDEIQQVTDDCYEYGEAQWQFGQHRWQEISENKIVAVGSRHEGDSLLEIAVNSGETTRLSGDFAVCAHLHAQPPADSAATANLRELLLIAHYADRGAEIRSLDFKNDSGQSGESAQSVYAVASGIEAHGCSRPQPIAYPTRDGGQAYAYFYAPFNRRHRGPAAARPPLLVMVHGGPTGRTTPELNPLKQFFTSLGYAVLDINHRGSTGYGRAYRQRLLGQWGEIDATDIADGVNHLVDKKLADPELVFIRGGSAGGYAVLRALTRFPRMFSGGACYYGIGNLITLAQITHKFEGYYTDRLIGEKFDPDTADALARNPASRFVTRSPVFQLDRLNSPLILFQGLEDKVVPPAISREVAELLDKKGIQYDYIEYADEGHGFRRLPNRVDSLKRETAFFAAIIRAKAGHPDPTAGQSRR